MKFKIGDKVMLKAVPYDDFTEYTTANIFYETNKKRVFKITNLYYEIGSATLDKFNAIKIKYLKHAVKPKEVKYTIDCGRMSCGKDCPERINGDVKICNFTGTKSQVEAHIKRYWKQPKIKAVK
jgi:hypothetical protein